MIATLLMFFIVFINEEVVTKEKMTISGVFYDLKIRFKYVSSHQSLLLSFFLLWLIFSSSVYFIITL